MQKTAYGLRISDGSSGGCAADLLRRGLCKALVAASDHRHIFEREDAARVRIGERPAHLRRSDRLVELIGTQRRIGHQRRHILHLELEVFGAGSARKQERSEEHTSELQSLMRISYAVFCLKKKKQYQTINQRVKHYLQQLLNRVKECRSENHTTYIHKY